MDIERSFVRIAEGQVHVRTCGEDTAAAPLYMIHASPASALTLVGLMKDLGASRKVIAPDTLGNGDSAPAAPDVPGMDYYGDSVARILDSMGLDKVDVYGSHTGAHIACELAIRHPDRVRRIIMDGMGMFSPEDKADFLERYAPEMAPDDYGRHLLWAWHFVREQTLYFPYFRRDPDHARNMAVPSAEVIQRTVLDVLKALTTYHKGYRASFRHDDRGRLPLITQPALLCVSQDDPLWTGLEEAASLVPGSQKALFPSSRTPEGHAAKIATLKDFLDR